MDQRLNKREGEKEGVGEEGEGGGRETEEEEGWG